MNRYTPWFPAEIHPVNYGVYDVIPKNHFPNLQIDPPKKTRAEWCFRFGQLGFWKAEVQGQHHTYLLIDVLLWRGRELPERVNLNPERRRVQLLPIDEPTTGRRRVLIIE